MMLERMTPTQWRMPSRLGIECTERKAANEEGNTCRRKRSCFDAWVTGPPPPFSGFAGRRYEFVILIGVCIPAGRAPETYT